MDLIRVDADRAAHVKKRLASATEGVPAAGVRREVTGNKQDAAASAFHSSLAGYASRVSDNVDSLQRNLDETLENLARGVASLTQFDEDSKRRLVAILGSVAETAVELKVSGAAEKSRLGSILGGTEPAASETTASSPVGEDSPSGGSGVGGSGPGGVQSVGGLE